MSRTRRITEAGTDKPGTWVCFSAPGRYLLIPDSPAEAWGPFTDHVEVGSDQYTLRQVNVFDNGNVLHYDRTHWCDDFGLLVGLRFSRKPKWGKFFPDAQIITAGEFEQFWRRALHSPLWREQLARSRVVQWGPCPFMKPS